MIVTQIKMNPRTIMMIRTTVNDLGGVGGVELIGCRVEDGIVRYET